jgi:hypothetical protein
MGYTHYWTVFKEHDPHKWLAFMDDVKILLNVIDRVPFFTEHIRLGETFIEEDTIILNGAPSCESLVLKRKFEPLSDDLKKFMMPTDAIGFGFCKTRRLPYDTIVVATLCLYKHHFQETVSISSDGDFSDWGEGVSLVKRIFDYEVSPHSVLQ